MFGLRLVNSYAPGKEREAVWTELLHAGVNLINTDDLVGLRTFLAAPGD